MLTSPTIRDQGPIPEGMGGTWKAGPTTRPLPGGGGGPGKRDPWTAPPRKGMEAGSTTRSLPGGAWKRGSVTRSLPGGAWKRGIHDQVPPRGDLEAGKDSPEVRGRLALRLAGVRPVSGLLYQYHLNNLAIMGYPWVSRIPVASLLEGGY
jgi:hypothetical protein